MQSYTLKATIFFMAMLCFASCGSKVEVTVDNPSDSTIIVIIDNKDTLDIPPRSLKAAQGMAPGKHIMQIGSDTLHFDIDMHTKSVMLNPLQGEYISQMLEYSDQNLHPIINAAKKNKIKLFELDSVIYWGNYELVTGRMIVMDKIDYGVESYIPDEIEINSRTISVRKYKLYRKKDFKARVQSLEDYILENPHLLEE